MRRIALTALLLGVGTLGLGAFSLDPIILSLSPQGPGSTGVFTLTNPGNRPVAVELRVWRREVNEEGQETRLPAEGLFSLFPSQVLLEPGQRRSVRVRWTGPGDLSQEQAFRLEAEQLPVDFSGAGPTGSGRIDILFRYMAALYVTPPQAAPQIEAQRVPAEGGAGARLVLTNSGGRHQLLKGLKLRVLGPEGQEFQIGPEELPGLADENLLAGSRRSIPVPEALRSLGVHRVQVELDP